MLIRSQPSTQDLGINPWPAGKPLMGCYRGFGRVACQSTVSMDRLVRYRLPLGLGFLAFDTALNMSFNVGAADPAVSSSGGAVGGYATNSLRSNVIVRFPLAFTDGTTLAQVASGSFDARYTKAISDLAAVYPNAICSLGHEMNFNGYPWGGAGKEADFVSAFQHVAGLVRAGGLKTFWNPAQRGWSYANAAYMSTPEAAWPGDTYVDYVGLDLYEETQFNQTDPQLRWDREMVGNTGTAVTGGNTLPYCLAWIAQWGQTHGKPVIIGEGATGYSATQNKNFGDNPTWWTNWVNWVHDPANNVYAHCIFDTIVAGQTSENYSVSLSSSITGITPNAPLDDKPNAATALRSALQTKLRS